MESRISNFWLFILIVLGLFLVWYFSTIIFFIITAAVLSLILKPVVNSLAKIQIRGWQYPRWFAALSSLILMLLAISGVFYFFIPLLLKEAQVLYDIRPQQVISYFEGPLQNLEQFLDQYDIDADPRGVFQDYIRDTIIALFDIDFVAGVFNRLFGVTLEVFIGVFSVFFITFFFLKEENMFPNIILSLTPDKHLESVKSVLDKIEVLLTRYFVGLIIQIICISTIASIGLMIVGLENPILIGVFAGVANIIPYLGPVLGATFGVLSGVLANLHLPFYPEVTFLLFQVLLVFLIVQQVDNLVFQPLIYSTSVKAHPVEIFIVILVAAQIAGIPGMIVAIPTYTVLRVVAKEFLDEFKFVQKLTKNL